MWPWCVENLLKNVAIVHWSPLSLTHSLTDSLTHSVTFSRLDWCDPGVWRCQLVEVVTVADEDRVGNSLLQIWELRIEQKFSYKTKSALVANMFLSINISNSNNLNKFWVGSSHARGTSIKSTKQELVSESVNCWQGLPMIGLGSNKNKDDPFICLFYSIILSRRYLIMSVKSNYN